jgi:hypothetical protein
LHGLKIWKKAGIKSTREQEKENFDIAQKELETEGNGSRKRMRICGAKEAIGDASWTEGALPKSSTIKELRDHASADAALTSFDDLDVNMLQFIPRKRTNTNQGSLYGKLLSIARHRRKRSSTHQNLHPRSL